MSINLFSDTQTRPTEAMRAAMAAAEVGDEQRKADPTVNELQARMADLLGKDRAIFFPTGTMCNLVAIGAHTRPATRSCSSTAGTSCARRPPGRRR